MSKIEDLLRGAAAAAQRGDWSAAGRYWRQVLEVEPEQPAAHHGLGVLAFQEGHHEYARQHLESAHRANPGDSSLALSLSVVLRKLGDLDAELRAIEQSLEADAYFLPGLLAKGNYLERLGRRRAAAAAYADALRASPPESAWPPSLRTQLAHAKNIAQAHGRDLAAHLSTQLGQKSAQLAPSEAARWREAGAILSGQSRPFVSHCNRLYVPGLAAIPFFDRSQFEWVESLESKTAAITSELDQLLREQKDSFQPYISYAPGSPVNQWKDLNHSTRWSSYFLWRNGEPIVDAHTRCPVTTAALDEIDMADIGGLCPNAMFSALAPHTHIPPHHGETNARVIVHLPLVVPEGCSYRVGFENRQWKVGQALIFDDTIEHEARNDSNDLRVVLIFDVWNPFLSKAEREMAKLVSAVAREFNRDA